MEDGTETPVQRLIVEECDAIKELLLTKNRAYGDSAIHPNRVFARGSSEEMIRSRIDDKLSRIARGREGGDEDTIMDLIGYLVLLRVCRKIHGSEEAVGYRSDHLCQRCGKTHHPVFACEVPRVSP